MSTRNAVLLNVDDSEAVRYSRTRLLRQAGFEVHEAGTGADALSLVRTLSPDIALLDVHLRDIDGIEVCRRIKADAKGSSTMVLQIATSAISALHATEALNSGADCYVVEPVEPEVLIATVRALLRVRRAERELARTNGALRETNLRLKEVNASLRRSNEDLEHFAHAASHDLQEPLRTVTTHVQLLQRLLANQLDDRARELFGFVVESAHRMSALIEGMLAYPQVGRTAQDFQPLPLDDAVHWATLNLQQSLDSVAGEVSCGDLPTVVGDAGQLTQVFQNLIGNAIKYRSSEPPRIRIEASGTPEGWTVAVRDNGMGIAPRFHDKIFVPFKRLHGWEIPGTGIGLALCRRIVENHGGRIWVESEEGHGATFFFTLPGWTKPNRQDRVTD